MKPIIFALLCAFAISFLSAQEVTVYGKILNPKGDQVRITYSSDKISYVQSLADTATLNQNGEFILRFKWPKPAFADFSHGQEYTPLFLQAGDSVKMELDALKFDESVKYSGKGAIINNYLAKKMIAFPRSSQEYFKLSEVHFLKYIDSVRKYRLNFFNTYFAKSKKKDPGLSLYKKIEEAEIHYEWLIQKLNYPDYNQYFNKLNEPPALSAHFYDFLKTVKLVNPEIMESGAYIFFTKMFIDREVRTALEKDSTLVPETVKQQIIEKKLSGEIKSFALADFAYNLLTNNGDLKNGKVVLDSYLEQSKNKQYKALLEKTYKEAETIAKGKPAPSFKLKDIDGNTVSVGDFKGKVIYMDVWASWCGPCMREVPYAKKLEEELHGKDIVFLNVSIDENLDAWKKAVRDKELKGIHINSKGGSESLFSQLYQIRSIPRYYIIDKNGNISNNNAKRPSENVKENLEELLLIN